MGRRPKKLLDIDEKVIEVCNPISVPLEVPRHEAPVSGSRRILKRRMYTYAELSLDRKVLKGIVEDRARAPANGDRWCALSWSSARLSQDEPCRQPRGEPLSGNAAGRHRGGGAWDRLGLHQLRQVAALTHDFQSPTLPRLAG